MNEHKSKGKGRPKAIPESLFVTVLRWKLAGKGYRRISNELAARGVLASKGSVERFIKAKPPYDNEPELRHTDLEGQSWQG